MFKLFALACIFATAFAAPGGVVVAPVAHVAHAVPLAHAVPVAHVAAPVAVSHSSSHVVHSAPLIKTVVSAPVVRTVVAAPVAHAVPVLHHHSVVGPALVKTVVPAGPVLLHH